MSPNKCRSFREAQIIITIPTVCSPSDSHSADIILGIDKSFLFQTLQLMGSEWRAAFMDEERGRSLFPASGKDWSDWIKMWNSSAFHASQCVIVLGVSLLERLRWTTTSSVLWHHYLQLILLLRGSASHLIPTLPIPIRNNAWKLLGWVSADECAVHFNASLLILQLIVQLTLCAPDWHGARYSTITFHLIQYY